MESRWKVIRSVRLKDSRQPGCLRETRGFPSLSRDRFGIFLFLSSIYAIRQVFVKQLVEKFIFLSLF